MAIKFNDFNNSYNNYNFAIGQQASKEAKKAEESKEIGKNEAVFKGLENETDLLTKTPQSVYGLNLTKFTAEDKALADSTNAIMESLGFSYKVTAAQAASVSNSMNKIVMPGMKSVQDTAVAKNIQDPNGPFADLFV